MPVYVLDTNILSLLQNGHRTAVARMSAAAATNPVVASAVTVDEQISGRLTQLRAATKPDDIVDASRRLTEAVIALAELPILALDLAALGVYDSFRRQKHNVKKNDLRIASIALVVTGNLRDFRRVPGLSVEDWSV